MGIHQEKDLGVVISSDLKVFQQCQQAYNKASRILGLINRTIKYRHTDILLRLYKSLVRPHLEYSISAWYPHYSKDKVLIERIQRRFTRMTLSVRNLQAEKNWVSLEDRRVRADRIYRGLQNCTWLIFSQVRYFFFKFSSCSWTRGHSLKLKKNRVRT